MTLYIQSVATEERCIIHENGRENRNHGNQEKSSEEEKETLIALRQKQKRGREKRPLSFCRFDAAAANFSLIEFSSCFKFRSRCATGNPPTKDRA
jgi:hypothetical protein